MIRLAAVVAALLVAGSAGAGNALAQDAVSQAGRQPGPAEIRAMVAEEARRSRHVPPSLALAVAEAESGFRADAESPAGARGVMQIMPATGRGEFGVAPAELWDARRNIRIGVAFLDQLIVRYGGRWDLALSHYNGGSAVGSGARARVIPATRAYVDKVLRRERDYARQAARDRIAAPEVAAARTGSSRPEDRLRQAAGLAARLADRPPGETPADRRRRLTGLADQALAFADRLRDRRPSWRTPGRLSARIDNQRARFRTLLAGSQR